MTAVRPLLLLGGASLPAGHDSLVQARKRGLEVWLADTAENLEHLPELTAQAARVIPLSYRDVDACVAWAVDQARTIPFIGVYGFRELAVESVAAVAEALRLPGNALADVRRVRNKLACRQALQARGFRQPPAALCSSREDALAFMAAHPRGPWIIKPPAAMGSVGVSLIRTADDLERALAYLVDSCDDLAHDLSKQGIVEQTPVVADRTFLMEGFQRGEEFSAEGVFVYGQPHVLAITAKLTTGAPHFVEVGHAMPAELEAGARQAVEATVAAALRALDLRWGAFHAEFWLDAEEPVLGEVHVRPGGDYIHFMTQHVTDVELHGTVFDQMLGRPLDAGGWAPRRGAAIRFLTPQPGVVRAVEGWNAVKADPQFVTGKLKLRPGDQVKPLRSTFDRSSFIVATGRTTEEAIAAVERLSGAVTITVDPA